MYTLKAIAIIIIACYAVVVLLLYLFQNKLIFLPQPLPDNYKFSLRETDKEMFIKTKDGEQINALFFSGSRRDVILYLHGNAGNLSGWQYAADDLVQVGFNVLIIDYRGYGKSSGTISEQGFYEDAQAAYNALLKEFAPTDIIIYGRSIGTGVAVELATKNQVKGLVLEAPYSSLAALANEKLPFFFPGLLLKTKFDNFSKARQLNCGVLMVHGSDDTLIPAQHSEKLLNEINGKKKRIIIAGGAHNDLVSFPEYKAFLDEELTSFFD